VHGPAKIMFDLLLLYGNDPV